jgi:hypothetical protein
VFSYVEIEDPSKIREVIINALNSLTEKVILHILSKVKESYRGIYTTHLYFKTTSLQSILSTCCM